jgi:hypothetical protein
MHFWWRIFCVAADWQGRKPGATLGMVCHFENVAGTERCCIMSKAARAERRAGPANCYVFPSNRPSRWQASAGLALRRGTGGGGKPPPPIPRTPNPHPLFVGGGRPFVKRVPSHPDAPQPYSPFDGERSGGLISLFFPVTPRNKRAGRSIAARLGRTRLTRRRVP